MSEEETFRLIVCEAWRGRRGLTRVLFMSMGLVIAITGLCTCTKLDTVSLNPTPQAGESQIFDDIEFVWIPVGSFHMGAAIDHLVELSEGFWLGKYEVTQEQWRRVMGSNPSYVKGDLHPVEQVSWLESQVFVEKLNELSKSDSYSLPTEAQWEYASRAGSTTLFSFGEDSNALSDYAWYRDSSSGTTHPIGEKKPNSWNLFDMYGNVWEWCADWKGLYPKHDVSDPTGPHEGELRILRGGSWYTAHTDCNSAVRHGSSPYNAHNRYGLRIVRSKS